MSVFIGLIRANQDPNLPKYEPIIMSGYLEKPARSKNAKGIRTWRKRYFVLQGNDISYFTSQDGEIKGVARVKGGYVHLLDSSKFFYSIRFLI